MGQARKHLADAAPGAFIGRGEELAWLAARIDAGERLITVTGPGGMGKTRLTRELVRRHAERFDGAWLADLTEVVTVEGLAAAVAHALGVPTGRGEALADTLGHALEARGRVLLVLDNFERLVGAAGGLIGAWLHAAPELVLLVTSRERLRLDDELVFELGPLPAVAPDHTANEAPDNAPDEAVADGVRLLLERASRHRAGWAPRPDDGPRLAELVERLDGIPLAIELAAARLPLLGPQTLLDRLSERFRILGSRTRDGADKGRTLRATLDWSWQLLDEDERRALAQASVFRGGFDLDAAEAVIDADGLVLERLESLFDKSLVRAEAPAPGEPARFGLYLTVRDFAAGMLDELGGDAAVRARHAAWFVDEASRRVSAVFGDDGADARRWLLRERENLAAVVEGAPETEQALLAALSLEPVLSTQGPFEEHVALLDRALARDGGSARARLEATVVRGNAHRQAGRPESARADLTAALEAARAAGHDDLAARALSGLATVELVQGSLEAARVAYEQALDLHRRADDRVHEAMTLSAYGAALAGGGDLDAAREVEERALRMHREAGNLRDVGMTSAFLGNLAIDRGHFDEARLCFADAAAIHDQLGDRFGQAFTEANLAIVDHRQRALAAARSRYDAAVSAFAELGARRYEGAFRGYRALAAMDEGDVDAARAGFERACARLREAGDDRFEALFRAHLAVARLRGGDEAGAERDLEAAQSKIDASGDPYLSLAVRLLHTPLWRARARGEAAAALEARVRAVLAEAEAGDPSPVSQSADALFALRAARAALGEPDEEASEDDWPADTLVVHPDADWMRPPGGARVELERREALRRLLERLCQMRVDAPGRPVPRDDLIARAWPGERILRKAAQNRLRVGIATLRKLGLADVLRTEPGGYRLDEGTPLLLWAHVPEGAS